MRKFELNHQFPGQLREKEKEKWKQDNKRKS
jgi:hypothetical protein